MKNVAFLFLLMFSSIVSAEEICALYENKIEPDHQWRDSDFTKEKAKSALTELSKIVNQNKNYAWNEITILNTLVEGFILKRSALEEIQKVGKEDKPYYKQHQSAYCAWLIATPVVD